MLNLVVVDASGRRSVSVPSGPFVIGRSSDSQLQLNDAHVSRKHAELVPDGAAWRIRDLGSRGGTFVNDTRIDDATLKPGDRVRIGRIPHPSPASPAANRGWDKLADAAFAELGVAI